MAYRTFDRSRLSLLPLESRIHDMGLGDILPLSPVECRHQPLAAVASRIKASRANDSSVVLMFGAHVLKRGTQRYIIDMMERGMVTAIASNGATAIHDYELARIGASTESVAKYIRDGQFGLWQETSELNDIVADAARRGLGLGEAVGMAIEDGNLPHKDVSVLAAAHRLGVPVTIHSSIGYDIVHEHPNCDGAAYGATSYVDFLRFAAELENLEGGVLMNFGSTVMAPEVYLKALSMVRNVAKQDGREVKRFTTLVCDLHDLPTDWSKEPPKDSPAYYFRPWKTMLVRTVADGGESFYVCGDHAETIPQLWTQVTA